MSLGAISWNLPTLLGSMPILKVSKAMLRGNMSFVHSKQLAKGKAGPPTWVLCLPGDSAQKYWEAELLPGQRPPCLATILLSYILEVRMFWKLSFCSVEEKRGERKTPKGIFFIAGEKVVVGEESNPKKHFTKKIVFFSSHSLISKEPF